jgi:hypothetical protein
VEQSKIIDVKQLRDWSQKKKLKKSLIETLKNECDLTRTNPHTQKEK